MTTIKEGDSIMIEGSDENCWQVRVKPGRKIRIVKTELDLGDLVGIQDGSTFDLADGGLKQVYDGLLPDIASNFEEIVSSASAQDTAGVAHDNSKFTDDNTAQGLSVGSIRQLQHRGVVGKELISEIARSSATFASRSEFSKEKWLKSKMRKYMRRIAVRRLTARTICDLVVHPRMELKSRPWTLRFDALSQVLQLGNVYAGAHVLVCEDTNGQLTGAIAERMGCTGKILSTYSMERMSMSDQVLRWYNLQAPLDQFIMQMPIPELGVGLDGSDVNWPPAPPVPDVPLPEKARTSWGLQALLPSVILKRDCDALATERDATEVQHRGTKRSRSDGAQGSSASAETPAAAEAVGGAAAAEGETDVAAGATERADAPAAASGAGAPRGKNTPVVEEGSMRDIKRRRRLGVEHAHGYLKAGMDSLVFASKHDITSTLVAALRWVKPGRPFVVFHWSVEVLTRAYQAVQALGLGRGLALQEVWCREYQMLPHRTHPSMMMDGASGFILSGIVVQNPYTQCSSE